MKRKILLFACALCVMLSSSIDVNAQSRFMNPRQVSAHVPIKTFDPHRQASRAPKTFSDATLTSGTYYTVDCNFYARTSEGWQEKTEYMSSVEVNVNGSDVTITGLAAYFPNAAIQGTMVGNTITFDNGQLVGTDDYGDEYLVGSNDGSTVCDIEFIYDPDARTLSSNTKYIIESNAADSIYPNTYWYYASFCSMREITIRLNPYSTDWSSVYAYVWTGSTDVNDDNVYPVIWGQQAQIDEEGWFAVSFQLEEATYHLGWLGNTDDYYILTNQTGSVCTEFNSNGRLQATTCKNLLPDESNTYTIHVATAGTFGQVLVQALGTKTWNDVLALTVTGTLNEADMQYLGRMANLQILDLSGTDITSIGGCKDLTKLRSTTLPATCIAVNDNAFYGCKRLSTINLDNIESLGNYAFYQSQNLSSLNLPKVLSVGNYAFAMNTCVDNYYDWTEGGVVSINMPIVQTIGQGAFADCLQLQSVTVPLVTSLGEYAFANCPNIVQLDLSNATSLGKGLCYIDFRITDACSTIALQSVTLSDELEVIPNECFEGCNKLTSITFPSALKEIGQQALPYLTNVQLPAGVQKVGSGNFYNATSITIPASVTAWGSFSNTWTDVYCYVISPLSFSAFNTSEAANMTLHVPAISLAAYKLHDYWYQFGRIIPMEGEISDITINDKFTLLSTEGIASNANLTLDSYGELTVSAGNTLALDNYLQWICTNNKIYKSSYSDGNEYYYSYMAYTGTLLANSAITANNVDVYLVIENNRWNFFSLPFDVDMSQFDDYGSDWIIREYSGANRASGNGATWNNVPANGMLHAHTGYILYRTSDNWGTGRAMTAMHNANMQNIFATGDVSVPLTEYSAEFPQNRSWNLIGNPYPCSYDIQYLDFDAPITTWNGSGYEAYTTTDDNYMLRPAEAFFVQAPQGTTQITFHKEGRSVIIFQKVTQEEYNNHRYYYAPKRSHVSNIDRKVFNFTLSNADYSDRARLVLNAQASADYELTRDAAKMMSSDKTVPQLFVNNNGVRYAIDERPEQAIYTLGAFFGKAGEYTLHLNVPENEDRQILLTDLETQTTTILTQGDYTFHAEAGMYESRFRISFVQNGIEGIDETSSLMAPTKTIQNGQLIIIKNDKMYDAQGQVINQ